MDATLEQSKKAPLIRFAGFTDSWEQRQLREISKEVRRSDPNSSAPVMMISASTGFIPQSEKYSTDNAGKSLQKYTLLRKGELAYNHGASKIRAYGSCFNLQIKEARIPFVYHCFSVEGFDPYFISIEANSVSMQKQLRSLVSSGARMDGLLNISYEDFASVNLSLPCIKEQQAVSSFFFLIETTIVLHQRKLDELQRLKKSLLQKMFPSTGEDRPLIRFAGFTDSWEQRKLSETCQITTGFPFKSESFTDDGDYLVLTNGNIQNDSPDVDDSSGNRILFQRNPELSKYILEIGDVLVTMDGTVGRSAKVTKHGQILAQRVARIGGNICQDFIFQILRAGSFEGEMSEIAHGGTIKHISLDEVGSFLYKSPANIKEIKEIASLLKHLDTTIVLHQRKLDELQRLKKSLLQKMFI